MKLSDLGPTPRRVRLVPKLLRLFAVGAAVFTVAIVTTQFLIFRSVGERHSLAEHGVKIIAKVDSTRSREDRGQWKMLVDVTYPGRSEQINKTFSVTPIQYVDAVRSRELAIFVDPTNPQVSLPDRIDGADGNHLLLVCELYFLLGLVFAFVMTSPIHVLLQRLRTEREKLRNWEKGVVTVTRVTGAASPISHLELRTEKWTERFTQVNSPLVPGKPVSVIYQRTEGGIDYESLDALKYVEVVPSK